MGMLDKLGEKRKAKLSGYVTAELPDAGEIEAIVPMVQTGNPMMQLGVGYYGIAITADRVIFVTYPRASETPDGVAIVLDRPSVKVEEWKPKMVASKLELGTGQGTFKMDVPRMHRDDGEALVAALRGPGG